MAVQLPDAESDRRRCEFCAAHVTPEFRRSYGTPDRRALRCPECDSWSRIFRGSACGRDVDLPDPQETPGRSGGQQLRSEVVTTGGRD